MFKLVRHKGMFPVRILVDFYFFDITEYECDKTIAISLTNFEKSV
jgi:hypothetical protein